MHKLAIMQPYFFPYIGYFSLMHHADEFVLFDTPQYDRKGWMNRNRILKPGGGWQYIRAGVVKPKFGAAIKDVRLQSNDNWKDLILRQLEHYRKNAPFYAVTVEMIEDSLSRPAKTLTQLNKNTLEAVRDYLGIDCPISIFSEMDLSIGDVTRPGQWALRISQALDAQEYINPVGGRDIFRSEEFRHARIKLSFLKHQLPSYNQQRGSSEEGLSIIDAMMFNPIGKIRKMLERSEIAAP